jgi:hypothetical protein
MFLFCSIRSLFDLEALFLASNFYYRNAATWLRKTLRNLLGLPLDASASVAPPTNRAGAKTLQSFWREPLDVGFGIRPAMKLGRP